MSLTTDPNAPCLGRGVDKEEVGQNECYLVLSEEEIKKGYVRPVRTKYEHRGKDLRSFGIPKILSAEIQEDYKEQGYYAYAEALPEYREKTHCIGSYLSRYDFETYKDGFAGGCGVETRMNETIAQTYARQPSFYGATYCMGCKKHLDVREFVWSDNPDQVVGS